MQIANTILDQLGGARFLAMTGGKHLVAGERSLQFRIGAGAVNRANLVRITLEASDLYTVEFYRLRGVELKACGEPLTGVYGDQLQGAFTLTTGMDTHL